MLIVTTACLIAEIPLSISRSLLFQIIISLLFGAIAIFRKPKYLSRLIFVCLIIFALLFFLGKTSFFQTATEALTTRLTEASEAEGGLVKGTLGTRYLGGLVGAFTTTTNVPFFGYGLGIGTNMAAQLSSRDYFALPFNPEDEWTRNIGELGLLMGIIVIICRIGVSIKMAVGSYKRLFVGDLLPWMLLSIGLLNIPQGQWGQPTTLGFGVLIGGLILASLKEESAAQKA